MQINNTWQQELNNPNDTTIYDTLNKMKPSEQCKEAGLKSLAHLVEISGVSEQTLINWHKNKKRLFAVVVAGACINDDKSQRNAALNEVYTALDDAGYDHAMKVVVKIIDDACRLP